MTEPIANDFADIARRMREIAGGDAAPGNVASASGIMWCNHCGDACQGDEVALIGSQRCCAKCLSCLIEYCERCLGGGWTMHSLPGGGGPHFRVCDACGNPQGNESPWPNAIYPRRTQKGSVSR